MAKLKQKPEEIHEILARRLFNRVVSKATVKTLFELIDDWKTKDSDADVASCQTALTFLKVCACMLYPSSLALE